MRAKSKDAGWFPSKVLRALRKFVALELAIPAILTLFLFFASRGN
tara:strand:- start:4453 stop:4587 length:135 start_codon:yes stop_codon:yes gene_type:complete